MNILALDFGASFVDVVLFNGKKILLKRSLAKNQYSSKFLQQFPAYDRLVTTGGKPQPKLPHLNEFDCLAQGGLFLASLKTAIVVSCGTGTAVVLAKKGQPAQHLGGTGIGGGTLTGLGRLLLGTNSPEKIFKLAQTGNRTQVDLTVGDILGTGIGLLPPQATAANFAKLNSIKKPDLAQGLVGMVSETIGVVACLATQSVQQKRLVFVGRLSTAPLIQTYLQTVCHLFHLSPIFPPDAHYATALGAALLASKACLKTAGDE